MDFTQYTQLLSYIGHDISGTTVDLIGQSLPSSADQIIHLQDLDADSIVDIDAEVVFWRFALSKMHDPFTDSLKRVSQLSSGTFVMLQDYLMADDRRVADYVNGVIHIFDPTHHKSFAQYEWQGLLLDVGLRIQSIYTRPIQMGLEDWIEHYQPDPINLQHAHIMFKQAPQAVRDTMKIEFAGTPFAKFELHEIICVAQKD